MNPDGQDFYKPEGSTAVAEPPAPAPAGGAAGKSPANNNFSWTASEYIDHNRNGSWYLMLLAGTVVLAGAIYFLTKEYFAVGVIVVLGAIVGMYAKQKPRQITYELTGSGLRIGQKLYDYGQFKSFSLVNEGGINSVMLTPLKKLMPPISAYYKPEDEERITDILGNHLPIEETKPHSIDRLSRRLKL